MTNTSYEQLKLDSDNETIYQNQVLYAERNKVPCFASRKCWSCGTSLKDMLTSNRTTQEAQLYAASHLLTGCYSCGRSWCD